QAPAADTERKQIAKILFEITLVFITFFLPGFLYSYPETTGFNLTAYMLQFINIALPQILFMGYLIWLQKPLKFIDFGISKPRAVDIPLALLIYVGIFALLLAAALLVQLLPRSGRLALESGFRWRLESWSQLPLALIFSLVTGYREEFFFRAYLLTRFLHLGVNPYLGVLAGTLLFSLGHLYQGPAGPAVAFIQGIYFGLIFLHKKNIHLLALAHTLYNFTILSITLVI
ncbi:MAG: CPBP family intramembrane metalloprotease, partial [Spirochaeta sp.]|nr:CPBP family intramembrane metalloprotease [Spirochaeta sp.]